MSQSKKETLKKEKNLRLFYRLLFILVSIVAPVWIVSTKYKLISEFSGYKLSIIGLLLCVIILWRVKHKIMEWVNSWEYTISKYIILGFSRVYLFILVLAILLLARQGLDNLIFCIEWVCLLECLAYLIIYPIEQRHDYNVKRIIRGIERKEDYKEAINELNGGN